jgi:hypothetical protein
MRVITLAFVLVLAACSHKPKPSSLVPAEGALDDLRAAVAREIKGPERAKQVAALVDELEQLTIAAHADFKAHAAALRTLNANYDATQAEFGKLFRDFNATRDARQARSVDINQRAKALVSAEEWNTLSRVREKAVRDADAAGSEF